MTALITALDLGSWFRSTAYDGSILLAVPVALVAGLVAFFSPCVVPLLPGYLSYATGLSGADLESASESGQRGRMLAGSLLFVAGFSFVFVMVSFFLGSVGGWLIEYQRTITIVLGAVTIVLGLAFLGLVPWFQRDLRIHRVPSVGLVAAPLLGVLFGLGWTPCIGPTLGGILSLSIAGSEGANWSRSVFLTVFFCIGLGLPFILAALFYRRMLGAISWVRRHQRWVTGAGGVMLVVVGILLVTGGWDYLVEDLRNLAPGFTPDV